MLAHHVLFWLKDDATEAEVNTFHQALKDLVRYGSPLVRPPTLFEVNVNEWLVKKLF